MSEYIPYGKQTLTEEDVWAVIEVLREDQFLTTGPRIPQFEQALSDLSNTKEAVVISNGTAALHAAIRAINLKPGEEVIVPAISFAASSNCVLYEQGIPVFADVEPDTLNLDPTKVEALITSKTKAILAVDFAGQVANYSKLREICDRHNLYLIADAAHSVGLEDLKTGKIVGQFADLTTLSFHPVKNMTTGEGGAILTDNEEMATHMRRFRNHGISVEYNKRRLFQYDITELGYNYRITDMQCALGLNQVKKVKHWIKVRQQLAKRYDEAFASPEVRHLLKPLKNKTSCAYHLYIILLNLEKLDATRNEIFAELKARKLGVNVHYRPIYLHTLYQNLSQIKSDEGLCPIAEWAYERMITIPMFPKLTEQQQDRVIKEVKEVLRSHVKA